MIENKLEHIQLPNGETLNIYADSALLYKSFDTSDELFDADKLYTFGNYEVPSDAVNLPVNQNKNGFMYVIEDDKKPIQIYSNRASKGIYYRALDETGNWSLWDKITGYNSLKSDIDDEMNRAMNEEHALDERITSETTDRTSADTILNSKITSETTERTNADTTLNSKITSETTERTNAINALTKLTKLVISNTPKDGTIEGWTKAGWCFLHIDIHGVDLNDTLIGTLPDNALPVQTSNSIPANSIYDNTLRVFVATSGNIRTSTILKESNNLRCFIVFPIR